MRVEERKKGRKKKKERSRKDENGSKMREMKSTNEKGLK